jgi:large repetitive protein
MIKKLLFLFIIFCSLYLKAQTCTITAAPGLVCEGTSANLTASGADYFSWYTAQTAGNLLSTGSSFTTPALSANQTYYVQGLASVGSSQNVPTTYAAGNNHRGNMFNVTTTTDVVITGFDISSMGNNHGVEVYYRVGGYTGFESNPSAWTLLGSTIIGASPALVSVGEIYIPAGQTYGLYVTSTTSAVSLNYSNGGGVYTDGTLTINTGVGLEYPFTAGTGAVYNPRSWNGTIHYKQVQTCNSPRFPVPVSLKPTPQLTVSSTAGCVPGNSTATVSVTGGVSPYSYSWDTVPVQTTATATGLAAGNYTVTVTDAGLCTTTQAFTITEPSALTATAGTQVDVLCFGNATGTATVNVTGGTGAYSYSWNTTPVQTTATATGLTAGTHTVTVTDANLCTTTQAFTITEPSLLVVTAGPQNNVLCYGNATGTAYVNANGGTGPYSYSWDTTPVQTAALATGLTAGTYTATVTDGNGCQGTQSFTITEPTAALVATAGTQIDVLCFGNATGAATVNVTGGTGAYSYSWDTTPVQTTATATGLIAGTYTVTVTDANLCTATQAFTITEPLQPLALTPNTTQTDVLCNGQATGSATVAVNGGTAPYSYLWNNGQTANAITGLIAGSYTVTVTDANGCTIFNSFVITEPTALVATAGPQTNVLCHGNATGSATVNVTGGTGAYVYNWSPSGGTAATATGLAAGTYTVTVTDANLCSTTQSFTITQPSQALATTPNTSQVNVSCFGEANGSATIAVNGGTTPYTYLWSNTQTNATATGLAAGTYNVVVTDANGCTLSGSFTITQPAALVAMAGPQTNVSCFGAANGSATVNVTGGTGLYSYSWNTMPVQTAATATGLAPGNYTVTITDANLCTATQDFTITQPQQLTAGVNNYANVLCFGDATGSATVSVAGGTLPYSYQWSNGQALATATNLTAGTYSVVVTDANGCQINAGITITQPAAPLFLVASQVNVNCVTATNGSITINTTGGVGPYTYTWTPAVSTTNFADNLGVGNYNVVVTDANGCSDIRYVSIAAPTAVTGYFTVTDATCYLTGSAVVHASGGVAPYTYLWSNGSITDSVQDVLPGTYSVTITDTNGCIYTLTTMINGTDPIVITSHPQDVTIDGGEDAVFTVAAQNVTTYQWQVSDDGGLTYTNLNSGGGPPYYYGVSTPTLTITNAYGFANGYKYRVILLKQSGCYVLTDAGILNINPVVVGTDDIKRMEMTVYPNPVSSDLFVKIPDYGLYGNVKVAMYDMNGRIVRREEVITSENYRIDVTELESAVYIVSITSDAGRTDKKVTIKK